MNTTPDPMQAWAGFWLKEQQRCWQHWAQSPGQSSAPLDLTAIAAQAWQQGNDFWLNSIRTMLPAGLAEPIAGMIKQSQEDLHQAFQAGQARQQKLAQGAESSATAHVLESRFFSLSTVRDFDPDRLREDPAWREYIQAFNAFVQFHIQLTVESLCALKTGLAGDPERDPRTFIENQLPDLLADYQEKLQNPHYRQIMQRLINSLAAMPGK